MIKSKKIAFFFLITCMAFSVRAQVIKNPSYEVKNTGIYNISKIELSKKETRLHISITFVPHWWVQFNETDFIKDQTGKEYKVIDIEGAELGKHLWMPDSGDSSVVLVFPPLDKKVEKIDFNNSIFGVSLKKTKSIGQSLPSLPKEVSTWLDNELAKSPRNEPIGFDSPLFFKEGVGRIVGYLKGYDTRLGFSTGIIYAENDFTRESYPIVVQIHPDGRFEANLPLLTPSASYIAISKTVVPFFVEPGQVLGIVLDWEEFLIADRKRNIRYEMENIEYQGPLAKVNDDIFAFKKPSFNYNEFEKKLKTQTPDEFKKETLANWNNEMQLLTKYAETRPLTPQAHKLLTNQIVLENSSRLFNFVSNREYFAQQDTANAILKIPVPDDYYDFLKELPLNDHSLVVSNEFKQFINRFEYCRPIMATKAGQSFSIEDFDPSKNLIDYLTEHKVEMDTDEHFILSILLKKKSEKDKEFMESNIELVNAVQLKFNDNINSYIQAYIVPLINNTQSLSELERWKSKDEILVNKLGLSNSFSYEVTKIRSLRFQFGNMERGQAYEYFDLLKEGISHTFLIETGTKLLNKSFPEGEKTAYELSNCKASDIFKKIVAPYKGKVLFVDFWATSCGPCIATIKKMKADREKYKSNGDFEFIFITDEKSSPEGNYKKFVEEQELEHTFKISEDDFNYLRELFKFNGIPRYVVIDREGRVLNDDFPMHNFNYQLENILSSN